MAGEWLKFQSPLPFLSWYKNPTDLLVNYRNMEKLSSARGASEKVSSCFTFLTPSPRDSEEEKSELVLLILLAFSSSYVLVVPPILVYISSPFHYSHTLLFLHGALVSLLAHFDSNPTLDGIAYGHTLAVQGRTLV